MSKNIIIEKTGKTWTATGEGLCAVGRTRKEAKERLEREISEFRELYYETFGKEEAKKILDANN